MKHIIILSLLFVSTFSLPFEEIDRKIVGGNDATPHQAPYMVSVQAFRPTINGYSHTCGGSIISVSYILTAAHCITEQPQPLAGPMRIVAGEHDLSTSTGREQVRDCEYINHENYTGGVAPFDIALLIPETPLELISGLVELINIPIRNSIPEGNVRLFGWGSTSTTDVPNIPNILQTVVKPLYSWELCEEILFMEYPLGTPFHITNVCTGPIETEVTACSG
jgi:prostasin